MSSPQDTSISPKTAYKEYGADLQVFFARHPVGHFVILYSLLFTFNIVWNAFFPHTDEPATYGGRILRVAWFTAVMTTTFYVLQRWRIKRRLSLENKP